MCFYFIVVPTSVVLMSILLGNPLFGDSTRGGKMTYNESVLLGLFLAPDGGGM